MGALTSRCRSQKRQQHAADHVAASCATSRDASVVSSQAAPRHCLDRVPSDVLTSHLLPFLDAVDVLELRRASTEYGRLASLDAVWRARLPADAADVYRRADAMTVYTHHARSRELLMRTSGPGAYLLYARGAPALAFAIHAFDIAWNDGVHPFWTREADATATFGSVMKLAHVSWLHARGQCRGVPRGRHAVHLRIKSSSRTFLENMSISMVPVRRCVCAFPACLRNVHT